MLFNSVEFAAFLAAALVLHHVIFAALGWRAQKVGLTVLSFLFYMSWSPALGVLLLASVVVNFVAARGMERATVPAPRRRLLLLASIAFNLGMLGWFKYGGFVAANAWSLAGWPDPPLRDVILPIGISFYTFESLSYTIDVYRGLPACKRLLDFGLFLSFFPHLVAGPIVRPRALLPQLATRPRIDPPDIELALARMAQGLVKKVLLADTLGGYVDDVWALPSATQGVNVWLAFYAYAFQIYFDFSGYTDLALGVAALFGLRLPENFDRPYLAGSPREFWQRWHISLSTWLRDYLYVGLGGNRGTTWQTYRNVFLTMLLGGLWHGAAWGFVLWGAYHGMWLIAHRMWTRRRSSPPPTAWRRGLYRIATFHGVCFGWVLFRAPDLDSAWQFLHGMMRTDLWLTRKLAGTAVLVLVGVVLHVAPPAARWRARFVQQPAWLQGVGYGVAGVLGYLLSPSSERFIYFQF